MTVWRPPQQIRVKVIGLAWRQDRLLAAEVEDDGGRSEEIRYSELDETAATARWFGRNMVRDAGIDLYPTGLEKVLSNWRD
ncbi:MULTISPECIES: hypothetical protein [Rhizobium]|uniref:Uncharacterized protein n=1 Tax=Rhizobium sophoriradicis TaxID=1535245 RepID=A0A2A5KJH5_9HYPH|nr:MULTISPECIES: hypothetical protein [Rhizobium]PCK77142.1 hypothetical protein CPT34_31565 [Rhizobium sophoriradicis]UWU35562.1 hypothetical protein N2597_04415 [Rhizobium leguminosarum bv. phaseoli]